MERGCPESLRKVGEDGAVKHDGSLNTRDTIGQFLARLKVFGSNSLYLTWTECPFGMRVVYEIGGHGSLRGDGC